MKERRPAILYMGEPLILCEVCQSFAVECGLVRLMEEHRKECDGQKDILLIRRVDDRND